jgi:hypothetical protein
VCAREHYCPRTIDPKVLDSLLSSTLHASTKPLLIVLAGPETLPGRDRPESHQPGIAAQPVFVASGSRYPRERDTFRQRDPCARRVPISPATNRWRDGECRMHDTSRHHTTGPSYAETHADLQPLPWRNQRTLEWRAPREGDAYRRPEAPSIEYIELELRLDWRSGWPLKRGARCARNAFFTSRLANPTRRTRPWLE